MKVSIITYSDKYKDLVKEFIISILEKEFGHVGIERPDLDNISEYYQTERGNFWLVILDNQIIGTVGLKDYRGVAYIKRMALDKAYRGKGIAQKLLKEVEKFARGKNFKKLYLSTSPNMIAANKFYKKEGFQQISKLPEEIPAQIAPIHYVKEIVAV